MRQLIQLAEEKKLPDSVIRFGIRSLCKRRLASLYRVSAEERFKAQQRLYRSLRQQLAAIATDKANEQHYELPPEFFNLVLGPQHKYSACYWPEGCTTLAQAEEYSLEQIAERAELTDGQRILELGCGWGSLSLWMAQRFPNSEIVAISNSAAQQHYIKARCLEKNIANLTVKKIDINDFIEQMPEKIFDRIVSIEMFEHMRNHVYLLEKLAGYLKAEGKLFIHIFCHKEQTYLFEAKDASDWMSEYFFTGGMMPAFQYPLYWQQAFTLEKQWFVNGKHYQKTAEAWLNNCDNQRAAILPLFAKAYGEKKTHLWLQRWRIFFMACAELFGYRSGEEWHVGHYLFSKY